MVELPREVVRFIPDPYVGGVGVDGVKDGLSGPELDASGTAAPNKPLSLDANFEELDRDRVGTVAPPPEVLPLELRALEERPALCWAACGCGQDWEVERVAEDIFVSDPFGAPSARDLGVDCS